MISALVSPKYDLYRTTVNIGSVHLGPLTEYKNIKDMQKKLDCHRMNYDNVQYIGGY
jgi:hypothetical protein